MYFGSCEHSNSLLNVHCIVVIIDNKLSIDRMHKVVL